MRQYDFWWAVRPQPAGMRPVLILWGAISVRSVLNPQNSLKQIPLKKATAGQPELQILLETVPLTLVEACVFANLRL